MLQTSSNQLTWNLAFDSQKCSKCDQFKGNNLHQSNLVSYSAAVQHRTVFNCFSATWSRPIPIARFRSAQILQWLKDSGMAAMRVAARVRSRLAARSFGSASLDTVLRELGHSQPPQAPLEVVDIDLRLRNPKVGPGEETHTGQCADEPDAEAVIDDRS